MRMRKKKNLEQKLAACERLFDDKTANMDFREAVKQKEYINMTEFFGNQNQIQLEIGCGKGQFVTESAVNNPDINYIAVEINKNVVLMAYEKARDAGINNILFMHTGAELLEKYIMPHSIQRIYLNFSCPYPKAAYSNRRLTNPKFLEIYKNLLSDGAEIHQKTDNQAFFEYSLEQFSFSGYKLKNISLDLHNSNFESNIITEYESKFVSLGKPIYRLEAYY